MEISLFFLSSFQVLLLFLLFISTTYVTAQSPQGTNFSCSVDLPSPCQTYVAYYAQPPNFLNLGNISDLFAVSRLSIASASNLVSEDIPLMPNQLLLVPITCGCTGNSSFANITYQIKPGDSFYFVSTTYFENLAKWQAVESFNPNLDPTLLHPGDKVVFPLFCKCPSKNQMKHGIQYLITYVWQPEDDIFKVGAKFNASPHDIAIQNNYWDFSTAVHHPLLIPVTQMPILSQPSPSWPQRSEHHLVIIIVTSVAGALLIFLLVAFLVHAHCSCKKKKKTMTLHRNGSCLETTDLLQIKEQGKYRSFEPKIIQDKLLPGVSGYLGKPIMYDIKEILLATMDLHEHYRIGGSVYRANINGQVLAVKKTKVDITEELNILQKVNHANLVKLMGISSNADGDCFLVYEYAENGSLDKWLHPKPASSSSSVAFLSWSQRLQIALDVASGLQYMHEHIQPTVVHMDIRTSNILLDSRFKAKIANFSVAKLTTDSMLQKVDVFAFGVVLLELLCGKKAMVTNENGEIVLLWKEMKGVMEVAEKRAERLKKRMDPNLENFYPIDSALSLANLARVCTLEKSSARPSMAEIVFNLTVLTQSCSETLERSWTSGLEAEEDIQITSPVIAR
ncbi:serine/threonine receptor-like kinase NFP [Ricinus communis]|uniref:Serine-threonine protein kinase, plant-type, putative n=1 Tax=Ricinus communis TaxID=3988 RepID=B9T4W1_RICCO|nr:serine/threonine receptor-like kinase NFP [Ricinus communis]EEF29112.1 serine-threonine protein kinase, plant-type, putative [Ricinus communis]|eukprot:XP_002533280.1 serine/threonine receptor-like kinase NFP [Ricinus communis]